MVLIKNFVAVVALASTAQAFFPWVPEYHCALDDTCVSSKRSVGAELSEPDLTLELVQRLPSVSHVDASTSILYFADNFLRTIFHVMHKSSGWHIG